MTDDGGTDTIANSQNYRRVNSTLAALSYRSIQAMNKLVLYILIKLDFVTQTSIYISIYNFYII